MSSISSQIAQLSGVNPTPAIIMPADETFAPQIIEVDQVDALEATTLLRDARFKQIGGTELHSGIHPIYGKCIISIYDSTASIIPFA